VYLRRHGSINSLSTFQRSTFSSYLEPATLRSIRHRKLTPAPFYQEFLSPAAPHLVKGYLRHTCTHTHTHIKAKAFLLPPDDKQLYTYLCQPPLPTRPRVPHKPLGPATNCFTTPLFPLFPLLYHTNVNCPLIQWRTHPSLSQRRQLNGPLTS
jgi:hypothetical protein